MTAKNTAPTLELRDPRKLKPHPVNASVYGDVDDSLTESIRKDGISEPIQILPDNTIVGGHRRRQGAIAAGVKFVPVNVRYDYAGKSDKEVVELLIRLNKTRQKTNEQIGREAAMLQEIEGDLAAARMKSGKASDPGEPFPQGKARDIIGKKLGVSGKTAEDAAKVVKRIDALEEKGLVVEAKELREELEKSVKGAAKSLKPKPQETKYDELIARIDFVMKVALPRAIECALIGERVLGNVNFQAGRAQQLIKTLDVMFTNANRIAGHARNKELERRAENGVEAQSS